MSTNFFTDNDDLKYYFERGIDWEPLVKLNELNYRSPDGFDNAEDAVGFYREILDMTGGFIATEIAPHVPAMDQEGVSLQDGEAVSPDKWNEIFDQMKALELHGMCLPRELGGMNCPLMIYLVNNELLSRADASVMNHFGFHGGMAMAMLMFSISEGTTDFDGKKGVITKTRFAKEIDEIRRGEAWGCMDITEPDAGSDMARLKAVGEQDEDGNWLVTGEKIFVTSGHGKYHFVIARTEKVADPDNPMSGLKGLSMFLVPTYEEDEDGKRTRIVEMPRLEHKLGHHVSVTASLAFDEAPAHLIGSRGEGFKHMLTLMNHARLGVGFEAIGMCEAAYRLARDYAAERPSMGKMIEQHEMIADYLDEMRTDIQGLRAIAMAGAYAEEMSQKIKLALLNDPPADALDQKRLERSEKRYARFSRRMTPLLKYLAAEKAVEITGRALQIHGGNGYSQEFGAEKLLRDSIVLPIYEGTSQIQALMAMKDALAGIMKNPQGLVKRMAQTRWRSLSASDPLERRVAKIQLLAMGAKNHLMTKVATRKVRSLQGKPLAQWPKAFLKDWDPKRDFAFAMLHAERLTRLLSDELVCEVLLEQAQKHPDRRDVLERYIDRCEPRCRFLHDEITNTGARLLGQLAEPGDEQADKAEAS
ncbi:MAG: hypothetical protein DRI90_10900 [Deltaproteobacteria bacterium]|nr:MAG: hypothetical protein DRI90_10900 [Deltaproteobacteria bacterium]